MLTGDVNTDAWSTMTTSGCLQSEADTVIDVSAVQASIDVARVGSMHAPITSVPSTVAVIATLFVRYLCLTIRGLALIGATTLDLHVTLPVNTHQQQCLSTQLYFSFILFAVLLTY